MGLTFTNIHYESLRLFTFEVVLVNLIHRQTEAV